MDPESSDRDPDGGASGSTGVAAQSTEPVVGAAFEASLEELEDDGVVALVVGDVPEDTKAAACRQFMGDGDEPRRRVVGLCGEDPAAVEERLPPAVSADDDHLRVVTDRTDRRDAAAQPGGPPTDARGGPISSVHVDDEIGSFGAAIADAIDEVGPTGRPFEAGELRVGVDELRPIYEQVPRKDVVQFVHLLGHQVRANDGKAHFHLPVAVDDPRASALATVCDVLVDLRIRDGRPQQRWHLRAGPTSAWLPVPADCE